MWSNRVYSKNPHLCGHFETNLSKKISIAIWVLKCFVSSKCDEVGFTALGMPDNYENQGNCFQTLFVVATSSLLTKYVLNI